MREFPEINLARCTLRRFTARHLTARYVGWLADPAVVRYSEQRHRRHDMASCTAYFEAMEASQDLFVAIEATDPALGHIGNMSVAFDTPNQSADVSIMVGEAAARGTGLGRLAWAAMVDWLLADGGMRRVTAGTMTANRSMIALMENSGMAIECVRPRAFLCEGEEMGLVLAARFADGAF